MVKGALTPVGTRLDIWPEGAVLIHYVNCFLTSVLTVRVFVLNKLMESLVSMMKGRCSHADA